MKASAFAAAAILVGSCAAVAALQPRLARAVHAAKERDDVYVLPPPDELRVLTLGWNATAVDLLWAKLLVEYGIHWSEHRELRDIPQYADAILALEPTYRPLYRIIDTLLAYRPLRGTEGDVKLARAYLERGTRERPNDSAIWLEYGQFMAFVAPSFIHDPAAVTEYRRAGAEALGYAVELGADADSALTAATLLDSAGVRASAISFLEHAYAVTPDDSDVHQAIGARLAALEAGAQRAAADASEAAIAARHAREMPYLTRSMYRLLGPRPDVVRCAGLAASDDPACARDWTTVIAADAGVNGGGP